MKHFWRQNKDLDLYSSVYWEGIIVALDRPFVVPLGGAGVDEGASVEDIIQEVPLLHRPLLHWHLHSMRGSQLV